MQKLALHGMKQNKNENNLVLVSTTYKVIDWNKIKTIEDVVMIMKKFDLHIDPKKLKNPRLLNYLKDENNRKI